MADIDNNTNATQLLEAVNTAFGDTTGIQEILASDNAADFVEKLNHNFEVMGTGGDAVFPANTILPCDIGSLEQGEDIGDMTMEDFITYGINSAPRKLTFIHTSDNHGNQSGGSYVLDYIKSLLDSADSDIDFVINTGDIVSSPTASKPSVGYSLKEIAKTGKLFVVPGNHDFKEGVSKNPVALKSLIKAFMTDANDNISADIATDANNGTFGCYWHKDFPIGKGKLRLIGIDQYNHESTYSGSGHNCCLTQEQITWFVGLLRGLTGNDFFMIAQHTPPMNDFNDNITPSYTTDINDPNNIMTYRAKNKFCSSRLWTWGNAGNDNDAQFIPSIVDAYISKGAINATHTFANVSATVTEDFGNVAKPAQFVGWLCGHLHGDIHGPHPEYTNQLVMSVVCGMAGIDPTTDLRPSDSSSQGYTYDVYKYFFNKTTIDFAKKTVHIERLTPNGQHTTAHTVNSSSWAAETNDPKGNGHTYDSVIRDEITFDFNANEVITNTNNEQENEN